MSANVLQYANAHEKTIMFSYEKIGDYYYAKSIIMEIKEIRKSTGLSQQKFADKFNIPVTNIQKWEQGIHKPLNYVVSMILTILEQEKQIEELKNGTKNEKEK